MLHRLAPRDARTAISFCREVGRASWRLATFAQASNGTNAAAPSRIRTKRSATWSHGWPADFFRWASTPAAPIAQWPAGNQTRSAHPDHGVAAAIKRDPFSDHVGVEAKRRCQKPWLTTTPSRAGSAFIAQESPATHGF